MWSDINKALNMAEFHGVVAAKLAGLEWPGELDAWVSLHPERMQRERQLRANTGKPEAKMHVAHRAMPGIDTVLEYKFDDQKLSGSSGTFAIKVALELLKFDLVVLCGMPLQKDQGRIDNKLNWNGASSFHTGFTQAMPAFRDRVRSMSGWTAIRVGTPTREWLQVTE